MHHFRYQNSVYPVPDYKVAAHRAAWDYLSNPGSWWTGAQRLAIAQSSRDARNCPLCVERKSALSPFSVQGDHAATSQLLTLPDTVRDAVHRISTDPARLTGSWVDGLIDEQFNHGHYVEMVSVIVTLISIDSFHLALGIPVEDLPEAARGEPDRYWPAGADIDVAWVPMIYPDKLSEREADIYSGAAQTGHVIRAMSLVPDAVRQLNALSAAHYLPTPEVMKMDSCGSLILSRPQTELIAARTSVLNDCFY